MNSATSGTSKSPTQIVDDVVADIESSLPHEFDLNDVAKRYPTKYEESMNTVLRQELLRYNSLIAVIRTRYCFVGNCSL